MQICYPGGAVRRDPATGKWVLDAGFDPASMALHLTPPPKGGVAALHDVLGRERARGPLAVEAPLHLLGADGGIIRVERVEVGAVSVLLAAEPLVPGYGYLPTLGTPQSVLRLSAAGLAEHAALGAGTMLATGEGELPVEWLRAGDRVLTRDNGFQPLRCVALAETAGLAAEAVSFWMPADAFGPHQPQRPLLLTRGQRVLVAAPELHQWFGETEMLARSDALAASFGITPASSRASRLFVLICARQEIVLADGLWLETALPSAALLAGLGPADRKGLVQSLAPDHTTPARAALEPVDLAVLAHPVVAGRRRAAA